MFRSLLTVSAVLTFAAETIAAPATKPAPATPLICPVTGEKIASVKDAVGSSVYKGKTYYFCCESCKPAFDKNPAKYVKTSALPKTAPAH